MKLPIHDRVEFVQGRLFAKGVPLPGTNKANLRGGGTAVLLSATLSMEGAQIRVVGIISHFHDSGQLFVRSCTLQLHYTSLRHYYLAASHE